MIKGGSFLIEPGDPQQVFTPEDFTPEHRMIAQTAADFVEGEVAPHSEELEEQKPGLMAELLKKAGELGLLSSDIPEAYGGMELDKVSTTLVTENLVAGGSFAVAHGAHTGIGTLPIVFFGTEEQKRKYLPDLATGQKIAAYALTEPGAGSDALAARTKAVLSSDGKHYLLNGTKQFITNAGLADLFITYAKIDGEKFTAFIVERDTPGFSTGPEEKKMGIKGSSTRSLIFEDARVPVENVLGEIGRGHVVAFNILNVGRFKLGAGCVGSSKYALKQAAKYALERSQFGLPIAKFGLIQQKIARMATATYAAESVVYRTAGLLDAGLEGKHEGPEAVKAIEEYAVECSINKVLASEVLDLAADETLQTFGGYGFTQEYPAERIYRDARINRIFEGTNEINRLLIPGTLLRRAQKGQLPLIQAALGLTREVMGMTPPQPDGTVLGEQKLAVEMAKKAFLQVAGTAVQKYMDKIDREQEILGWLADMAIQIFAMESAVLRAEKALGRVGAGNAALMMDLAKAYVDETVPQLETTARATLGSIAEGDELRTHLSVLRKFTRYTPTGVVATQRRIAERILDAGGYAV
ncbi:MAG: acyl-CoA dehydrogenase family protein [Firmicutes bacterium]|nr:acyl-CoA dehydrogenase family protein [Bacillota bacterium]